MTIDELLDTPSCTARGDPHYLTIRDIIAYTGFDIGVTSQEQKDLPDGHLLVIGSRDKTFIHPFITHRTGNVDGLFIDLEDLWLSMNY